MDKGNLHDISRLVSHGFRFYDGLCDDLLGFRLPLANKILELLSL